MMQLPVQLNAHQEAALKALVLRGEPDLVLIDQAVNGSELLVIVARGRAREFARRQLLTGEAAESPEEPPEAPPVKVVKIRDGVQDNRPPGK
jgi:hypothetical protein